MAIRPMTTELLRTDGQMDRQQAHSHFSQFFESDYNPKSLFRVSLMLHSKASLISSHLLPVVPPALNIIVKSYKPTMSGK